MFLFYNNGDIRSAKLTDSAKLLRTLNLYLDSRISLGSDINQATADWNMFVGKYYRKVETMEDVINFIGSEEISIKIKNKT